MIPNPKRGRSNAQRTRNLLLGLLILAAGLWFYSRLTTAAGNIFSEVKKVTAVMSLIKNNYVEEPDLDLLATGAIEGMLERLDPHSIYIPAREQERIAETDIGEFEGIGISFVIQDELITVIAPIPGTPADLMGLRSGDRIIEINGVSAYAITNEEVFEKLRGPRGSSVKVTVAREGIAEPLHFTIVRDRIPINSVWTSFMLDDSTGYVMLNQFTATTAAELDAALHQLESAGMTRLIFDLRNNQGGRLSQAVAVADMFIPGGYVMVSRQGRHTSDDSVYHSSEAATHPLFQLIVLINGGSASASEIVAGAVQDLDRGLVVGSRSFGKGLVQYPYRMKDGAVIRLSTAKWFTPSGRLVQRSYDEGRGEYYAVRYRQPDSAAADTGRPAFKTLSGRVVYGLSGITPDHKVAEGTISAATARMMALRLPFEFAGRLKAQGALPADGDFAKFRRGFRVGKAQLNALVKLAGERGIEVQEEAVKQDERFLAGMVKAEAAQLLWNNRDYYYIVRSDFDTTIQTALKLFPEAREVAAAWFEREKG